MKRVIHVCGLALCALTAVFTFGACSIGIIPKDTGSGGEVNSGASGGTGGATDGGGASVEPAFDGFDFALSSGDFWEFSWDYYSNSWAQGSSPTTDRDSGKFWVQLGSPRQIQGTTAYVVNVYGKTKNGGDDWARSFSPIWKYLATDGGRILGSTDGATLAPIFDAKAGKWPGGASFPPSPRTVSSSQETERSAAPTAT